MAPGSKYGPGAYGSDQATDGTGSQSIGAAGRIPHRNNYGGIGRMVLFDEDAPIHRSDKK